MPGPVRRRAEGRKGRRDAQSMWLPLQHKDVICLKVHTHAHKGEEGKGKGDRVIRKHQEGFLLLRVRLRKAIGAWCDVWCVDGGGTTGHAPLDKQEYTYIHMNSAKFM